MNSPLLQYSIDYKIRSSNHLNSVFFKRIVKHSCSYNCLRKSNNIRTSLIGFLNVSSMIPITIYHKQVFPFLGDAAMDGPNIDQVSKKAWESLELLNERTNHERTTKKI